MKPISLHVDEERYEELKKMAGRRRRPVAELLREAMEEYIDRERRSGRSVLDLPPVAAGEQRGGWSRTEIYEEMIDERLGAAPRRDER